MNQPNSFDHKTEEILKKKKKKMELKIKKDYLRYHLSKITHFGSKSSL